MLSAMRFIAYGFTQDMISKAVRMDSGLVEVAAYGWVDRPTLYRALETQPGFLQSLRDFTGKSISPRIKGGALLNFGEKTRFVSILAADPPLEAKITTLHSSLVEGNIPLDLDPESTGRVVGEAMIGDRLSRALGATIGSQFYLISSKFDGSLGAIEVRVTGIFKSGAPALDSGRVVIPMETGHRLFGTRMDDREYYTDIAIQADNFLEASSLEDRLAEFYGPVSDPDGLPPEDSSVFDPVVLGWNELNPGVLEMTVLASKKMDTFLLFFIVSISFGILNTIQMSIQERMREFGVLLAIGTGTGRLTWMLIYEVFFLVVPGVLLGILLASLLGTYWNAYPLDLSGTPLGDIYSSMGFAPRFKPIVNLSEMLKIGLSLIVPALAVGFFATGRVRKMNPVQIIQTL